MRVTTTPVGAVTPASTSSFPSSSTRRATGMDTARTPQRRPGATPTRRPPAPAAVFGSISGMAPRARIAAYKVCWADDGHRRRMLDHRQRGSDRPGRCRWRGRHQFLDQRHQHELPRPGRDRLPVRRRCRRLRRGFCRQQRADHQHSRAPGPLADHGGRGHPQPRRPRFGDAGQRRDLLRRFGGGCAGFQATDRFDRRRRCRSRSDGAGTVLRRRRQRRRARCSTRPRWRARSSSATAA